MMMMVLWSDCILGSAQVKTMSMAPIGGMNLTHPTSLTKAGYWHDRGAAGRNVGAETTQEAISERSTPLGLRILSFARIRISQGNVLGRRQK